jgi:hypothetical protein
MNRALCLVLATAFPGCAPFESPYSKPQQVAANVTRSSDQYTRVSKIAARPIPIVDFPNTSTAQLVSLQGRSNEIDLVVQAIFLHNAGGWRFLEQAFDSQGTQLATKVVSQDSDESGVTETVAIAVPKEYLVAHSQSGLDIKIVGRRGDVLIKLPASYVQGFLLALQ